MHSSPPTSPPIAGSTGVPGLEDDEAGARVVREELRLLETVLRTLDAAASSDVTAARGRQRDDAMLLELREDVSTAKPEDLPALFEQMHNVGALRAQRGRGQVGAVDRGSPYFAHLRLEENGKRRDVLIGQRSWIEGAGVRIVDWRHAPVSKIFYRYQEGDAYEEELGDRIVEGAVLVRRTVAVAGGELRRVASPEGTFVRASDGRWARVQAHSAKLVVRRAEQSPRLGVGADGRMREDKLLPAIASMLDEAQYALITKPSAGLVVIQGSAGSGKTTVGLHRVAYLAFADPQRYRPDRMMVVVPNDALLHYTARVLPSLGVEDVTVTTFARWAKRVVPDLFPKVPSRITDDTPPVVSRAKSHPAMLRAIASFAVRIDARLDERVGKAMASWPDGNRVIAAWNATRGMAPDARVTGLAQWLAGKRTLPDPQLGAAATLPDVTRGALERLGQDLRHVTRALLHVWDELLTSRELLGESFAGVPELGPGQLDQVHAWCVRQSRIRHEGERDGEDPSLDAEDPALLLRVWQVIRGPIVDRENRPLRLAHMFVDEVQDASPVELRVLLDLVGDGKSAPRSVTFAGDTAQRMFGDHDDRGELDWAHLLDDLGVSHTAIEPLKVSYRSTAEITTFARGVLGPYAHEAEPIATRHGPPVELFAFASPGETVAFLADALRDLHRDEPNANVALIARFGPQADVYYEGLTRAEVAGVRRVAKHDFTWEPGVDVTDVMHTKGLEFDEVVLLETTKTSYPDSAPARHALYVGATRAAHQLWCMSSEAPSLVVTEALAGAG
jgi:DNA helicase II / ATP-dependent DNA helicase PcrA